MKNQETYAHPTVLTRIEDNAVDRDRWLDAQS